ncbi:MAG: 50S ribosomal protein L13 [Puniceicoccales bacterium]|jgi:large subunit ribosomal protein L13|nr:50S ribosomal protein L13 [Puniceicoccales bacterium]
MSTTLAKKEQHDAGQKRWVLLDAEGESLGRLAVRVANILRGRHRPIYTPHVDTGDFIIIINADKVRLTGAKDAKKKYMFYSGYIGNERYSGASEMRGRNSRFLIEHAVKGMLPKNRLADQMIRKLKVYGGTEHGHEAQMPIKL